MCVFLNQLNKYKHLETRWSVSVWRIELTQKIPILVIVNLSILLKLWAIIVLLPIFVVILLLVAGDGSHLNSNDHAETSEIRLEDLSKHR